MCTPNSCAPLGTGAHYGVCCPAELSDQIERALQLEEERRHAQEEAERLEADRLAALRAKEELERQTEDQIKSQEQLVGRGQRPALGLQAICLGVEWLSDELCRLGGPVLVSMSGR